MIDKKKISDIQMLGLVVTRLKRTIRSLKLLMMMGGKNIKQWHCKGMLAWLINKNLKINKFQIN
jgi:hypothetical protein